MYRFTFLFLFSVQLQAALIERLWLTHASNDCGRITISWETEQPGASMVEYGTSEALGQAVSVDDAVTIHHVEIPIGRGGVRHFYRVRSGADASAISSFRGYAGDELRVGIFADRGYARDRDLSVLVKEDLNLLLTAGDNVASLHEKGIEGTKAFSALIDSQRDLFRSTPFMPVLGNHDREMTPRGSQPPDHPVYDVDAVAFRSFFPLPEDGWKWRLDLPRFGVRFLALDASHTRDQGTTWQTNHPIAKSSVQYGWYAKEVVQMDVPFLITLDNEQNALMRGYDGGAWLPLFLQCSAVITGYGYFGERAEVEGMPFFNTCLKGNGDLYKDPKSVFVTREDNYILLTLTRDAAQMKVEIKNFAGDVLDVREISRR